MLSATENLVRRRLKVDHRNNQLGGQCDIVKLLQGKDRDKNPISVSSREDGKN